MEVEEEKIEQWSQNGDNKMRMGNNDKYLDDSWMNGIELYWLIKVTWTVLCGIQLQINRIAAPVSLTLSTNFSSTSTFCDRSKAVDLR